MLNRIQNVEVYMLAPINFKHKAGDGTKTRERKLTTIVPALQSSCGETQCSYVLEVRRCSQTERSNLLEV